MSNTASTPKLIKILPLSIRTTELEQKLRPAQALASPNAIPTFSGAQVPLLTPAQVPDIIPVQVPALTPAQLPLVLTSPQQVPTLSSAQLPFITSAQVPDVSPAQVSNGWLAPVQVPAASALQVPLLQQVQIPNVSPAQITDVSPAQVPGMSPAQVSVLNAAQVPDLAPVQVPDAVSAQVPDMIPVQVPTTSSNQVPALSAFQISALSPSQIQYTTPVQVPDITPAQVPYLVASSAQVSSALVPTTEPALAPALVPGTVPSTVTSSVPALVPGNVPSTRNTSTRLIVPTQVQALSTSQVPVVGMLYCSVIYNTVYQSCCGYTNIQGQLTCCPGSAWASYSCYIPCCSCGYQGACGSTPYHTYSYTQLLPLLNPAQVPATNPAQVNSGYLSPAQVPTLNASQVPALSVLQVPLLTPSLVPNASPIQANQGYLSPMQLPLILINPLAVPTVGGLQVPLLNDQQVPNIIPVQVPALTPGQLPVYLAPPGPTPTPAPVAGPAQVPALSAPEEPGVDPLQIPVFSPAQVPAVNPLQIPALSPGQSPTLSPVQLPAVIPAQVPSLSSQQEPSVDPVQIPVFSPVQVPYANPAQIPALNPKQSPAISPVQVPELGSVQIPAVSPTQVSSLSPAQVPAINPEQLSNLNPVQIPDASPVEVPAVSPAQTPVLSPAQSPVLLAHNVTHTHIRTYTASGSETQLHVFSPSLTATDESASSTVTFTHAGFSTKTITSTPSTTGSLLPQFKQTKTLAHTFTLLQARAHTFTNTPTATDTSSTSVIATRATHSTTIISASHSAHLTRTLTPSVSITLASSNSEGEHHTSTATTTLLPSYIESAFISFSHTATASRSNLATDIATSSKILTYTSRPTVTLTPSSSHTESPSTSLSHTATSSASALATDSSTLSHSTTHTSTDTSTITLTPSTSHTESASTSLSLTATSSASALATDSSTLSHSATHTSTDTSTITLTPSTSHTESASTSLSLTATSSASALATDSSTLSHSGTYTSTGTPTITLTPSTSHTESASTSLSLTATRSHSTLGTDSSTLSHSATHTSTGTPTITLTPSHIESGSTSLSHTATSSHSNFITDSASLSRSATHTSMPTVTLTSSHTESASTSLSHSASASRSLLGTGSSTISNSVTHTSTNTPTITLTPSRTESASISLSHTATATGSTLATNSITASDSVTYTSTNTPTLTATPGLPLLRNLSITNTITVSRLAAPIPFAQPQVRVVPLSVPTPASSSAPNLLNNLNQLTNSTTSSGSTGSCTLPPSTIVTAIGDMNCDGVQDVLVRQTMPSGVTNFYVMFRNTNSCLSFSPTQITGVNGFQLLGLPTSSNTQLSFANAGDLTGKNCDSLVIGDPSADNGLGQVYVVYGADTFPPTVNVTDGSDGFTVQGTAASPGLGTSVQGAGDVNGKGVDSLVISTAGNGTSAPESFVINGRNTSDPGITSFPQVLNASSISGTIGYVIRGAPAGATLQVIPIGDFNKDGKQDVAVCSYTASSNGNSNSGTVWIVYGGTDTNATVEINNLDGSNGFIINGIASGDLLGYAVSGIGDFNGDGIDDFIIGAYGASPSAWLQQAGRAFIIFGTEALMSKVFDLNSLNGRNGLILDGINKGDHLGYAVAGVGDLTNSGYQDAAVSAPSASSSTLSGAGAIYILCGSSSSSAEFTPTTGNTCKTIQGTTAGQGLGATLSSVGNSSTRDLILGNSDGSSQYVFGQAGTSTPPGSAGGIDTGTLVGIIVSSVVGIALGAPPIGIAIYKLRGSKSNPDVAAMDDKQRHKSEALSEASFVSPDAPSPFVIQLVTAAASTAAATPASVLPTINEPSSPQTNTAPCVSLCVSSCVSPPLIAVAPLLLPVEDTTVLTTATAVTQPAPPTIIDSHISAPTAVAPSPTIAAPVTAQVPRLSVIDATAMAQTITTPSADDAVLATSMNVLLTRMAHTIQMLNQPKAARATQPRSAGAIGIPQPGQPLPIVRRRGQVVRATEPEDEFVSTEMKPTSVPTYMHTTESYGGADRRFPRASTTSSRIAPASYEGDSQPPVVLFDVPNTKALPFDDAPGEGSINKPPPVVLFDDPDPEAASSDSASISSDSSVSSDARDQSSRSTSCSTDSDIEAQTRRRRPVTPAPLPRQTFGAMVAFRTTPSRRGTPATRRIHYDDHSDDDVTPEGSGSNLQLHAAGREHRYTVSKIMATLNAAGVNVIRTIHTNSHGLVPMLLEGSAQSSSHIVGLWLDKNPGYEHSRIRYIDTQHQKMPTSVASFIPQHLHAVIEQAQVSPQSFINNCGSAFTSAVIEMHTGINVPAIDAPRFHRDLRGHFGQSVIGDKKAELEAFLNHHGITTTAATLLTRGVFKDAVLKLHPDRGGTTERFQKFEELWSKSQPSEQQNNEQAPAAQQNSVLSHINHLLYNANIAVRIADVMVSAAEVYQAPTTKGIANLAISSTYACASYLGATPLSAVASVPDLCYTCYVQGFIAASFQAAFTLSLMALPIALAFAPPELAFLYSANMLVYGTRHIIERVYALHNRTQDIQAEQISCTEDDPSCFVIMEDCYRPMHKLSGLNCNDTYDVLIMNSQTII